ncbi:MAG: molybdopterin-binding protein [Anaerolineaceae bacterium]|nr:molybdopterin-binding protein [Anaerolineaceae bacterium]
MKFGPMPVAEAVGHVLAHNLLDERGHKILSKGRVLTTPDADKLRALNYETVIVAALDPTDLSENDGARRVGEAVAGPGIKVITPGVGRANLISDVYGPAYINVPALERLNNIDAGITIATLRTHTLVQPGELVALVKIIPFAIPEARVIDIERKAGEDTPVLAVHPLQPHSAALILTGPESARPRLTRDFEKPTRTRLEKLGSQLENVHCVEHQSPEIAAGIRAMIDAGRNLLIIAGISAIIDQDDVVPSALRAAGGDVAHFGVPVDPGSLLMLGYVDDVPVLGAPGCIKSLKTNVIDWLLPRLLAGERLTRADLVAMGHGGLLDDISERPMPRSKSTG